MVSGMVGSRKHPAYVMTAASERPGAPCPRAASGGADPPRHPGGRSVPPGGNDGAPAPGPRFTLSLSRRTPSRKSLHRKSLHRKTPKITLIAAGSALALAGIAAGTMATWPGNPAAASASLAGPASSGGPGGGGPGRRRAETTGARQAGGRGPASRGIRIAAADRGGNARLPTAGHRRSSAACSRCGTRKAAGTPPPAIPPPAPTASRRPCPGARWPAPARTGRPARPPRSAGASGTSGRCTAHRARPGRTSRPTAGISSGV
jgi:hypothetical protein